MLKINELSEVSVQLKTFKIEKQDNLKKVNEENKIRTIIK